MTTPSPLPCPVYLGGALARRWEELAPELQKLGTLDALNVDLCGKYILAENEYLRVSALVQEAIAKATATTPPSGSACRTNSPNRSYSSGVSWGSRQPPDGPAGSGGDRRT